MPKNIFRVFNPKGTPEDRTEKRRAQLRHAQQTYRERKDRYTKALEAELAQSRAREAHLVLENERLESTVKTLQVALAVAHNQTNTNANGYSASNSAGLAPWSADLNLDLEPPPPPSGADFYSSLASKGHGHGHSPAMLPSPASATDPAPTSINGYSPHPITPTTDTRVADLDPTDVGMEFVLTLEEPCLGHLHGDPEKDPQSQLTESNNHALTISSKLCAYASTRIPSTKNAPHSILASLLKLSPELGLPDAGLTPVQAWNRVCQQPEFARLDLGTLQSLAANLRDLVQCHGFGAVIEQDVLAGQVAVHLVGV